METPILNPDAIKKEIAFIEERLKQLTRAKEDTIERLAKIEEKQKRLPADSPDLEHFNHAIEALKEEIKQYTKDCQ